MLAHRYAIFLFSLDVEIDDSLVGQLNRAAPKRICFVLRSFLTIELHRDPILNVLSQCSKRCCYHKENFVILT